MAPWQDQSMILDPETIRYTVQVCINLSILWSASQTLYNSVSLQTFLHTGFLLFLCFRSNNDHKPVLFIIHCAPCVVLRLLWWPLAHWCRDRVRMRRCVECGTSQLPPRPARSPASGSGARASLSHYTGVRRADCGPSTRHGSSGYWILDIADSRYWGLEAVLHPSQYCHHLPHPQHQYTHIQSIAHILTWWENLNT